MKPSGKVGGPSLALSSILGLYFMVIKWLLRLQPSGAIIQSRKKEERERVSASKLLLYSFNYIWPPREGIFPSSKVDSGKGKNLKGVCPFLPASAHGRHC